MRIGISGTPGTGKSTLCQGISEKIGMRILEITKLSHEKGWIVEKDEKRDTDVVDTDKAKEYCAQFDDAIIDSHFAEKLGSDIIIVIRCEPRTLYERLSERGYSKEKIRENLLAEMLDICLIAAIGECDKENVFEIIEYDKKKAIDKAIDIINDPDESKSIVYRQKAHFLTDEYFTFLDTI